MEEGRGDKIINLNTEPGPIWKELDRANPGSLKEPKTGRCPK